MNTVRASLCIVIVFSGLCSPEQTLPSSSHGTVNILLANKNGLVAVTDSMLTFGDGTHRPIGRKLFKNDDRTICTIAGSYTAYVPPPDLGLDVRKVVDSLSIRLRTNPITKLSSKLELLTRLLKIALQSDNLTSQIAFGRANTREPIQLTMAGYDDDGQLRIEQVDLLVDPSSTQKNVQVQLPTSATSPTHLTPICEIANSSSADSLEIKTIRKDFVCRLAGYKDVAESLLIDPERYKGTNPSLLKPLSA